VTTDLPPIRAEREAVDRRWRLWASVTVGSFVAIGLVLGLLILPMREQAGFDPFAALCRAIGIPGYERVAPRPAAAPTAPVSDVTWSIETRRLLAKASVERGAAVARVSSIETPEQTCISCHGENGISVDQQQFPNLAGQSNATIFKQLRDFQTGMRKSDVMEPIAQPLKQEQMADVAAYFSSRRPADLMVAETGVSLAISHLAQQGDPARGIPSCDSCHGPSRSGPEETPILLGQSTPYLEQQLKNFATAARGNDVFERMRAIAHQLTPDEIYRLAIYYGGMPAR
jgi:cytochrome c553